jgi:uncharacterized protein involved in exopolysaccharide biosynthesis
MDEHAIPWQELAAVLLRRWKLIFVVFASGLATALVFSFLQVPAYKATAKLMVTSKRARITVSPDPRDGATVDRVTEKDLNSEVALLRSESLVREVLEALRNRIAPPAKPGVVQRLIKVVAFPLRLPGILYRTIHHVSPPTQMDNWVNMTMKHLSVSDLSGSNLIEVSYQGSDPAWAAELVNKLVKRHIERHAQLDQQSEALGFFESQRRLLSQRMQKAQQALSEFYDREGIEPGADQRTALGARLSGLKVDLAKAQADLAEGEARSDYLTRAMNGRSQTVDPQAAAAQGSPLQLIRSRVLELELQRTEALSKYAPTSTMIRDLDRQIVEARRLMTQEEKRSGAAADPTHQALALELAQTQAQLAAVKARSATLQSQVADSQAKLEHLDQVASQQDRLEQDVAAAKESLLTYSKKQEEARFSDALDESKIVNVTLVEPAVTPMEPLPSKRILILALGAIMSLMAGVGLAFARDRLDPVVKGAAEAHRLTNLPILANIPL